jgi:NAD(P)-dependent dehydrogenase (short-subunit alcohol dehydrogenase family)
MSRDLFDLTNKVAIITGGNGFLGGAMAKALACYGARTVIIGRNRETVKNRACEIVDSGRESIGIVADVLSEESLNAARDVVMGKFGRIDILINAAGGNTKEAVIEPNDSFFKKPLRDQKQVIELNLLGTMNPIHVFGNIMCNQETGTIINISSEAVPKVISRVPGYSAAKAAVENFTRWLAVDLATRYGDRIRVNGIRPGFFLADQNRRLLTRENGELTSRGDQIVKHTPMGRFGHAEELEGVVIFLASEASKFVTGEVITVDGGFGCYSGV